MQLFMPSPGIRFQPDVIILPFLLKMLPFQKGSGLVS